MNIKTMFTVGRYDYEGDLVDEGVFLNIGDVTIRVADTPKDYDNFVNELHEMSSEIHEVHDRL